MFALVSALLAQDAPKQGTESFLMPFMFILLLLGFFLLVIRPQMKRQERERQQMMSGLEKNDKVLTTAGIYGTVISVSENEDECVVKVDDNTRLRMLKSSIHRNITKEEQAKAQKEQAAQKK